MKKGNERKPNNTVLYLVCLSFAILNLISLRTNINFFSYLSIIPFLFLIIEVFSRIIK